MANFAIRNNFSETLIASNGSPEVGLFSSKELKMMTMSDLIVISIMAFGIMFVATFILAVTEPKDE